MKQNNTNRRKKLAPVLCALVIVAIAAVYLAIALIPLITDLFAPALAIGFCILYAGIALAVIIGVLLALRQRLQEIREGEEEDASQY